MLIFGLPSREIGAFWKASSSGSVVAVRAERTSVATATPNAATALSASCAQIKRQTE
jgi:hypothetical protein